MIKGPLKTKLSLWGLGIILGISVYLGPSIILSVLVLGGIFSFVFTRPPSEKKILAKVITVALILRLIFFAIIIFVVYCVSIDISENVVIFKMVGHTGQVVRDLTREIKNGIHIAHYLKGEFGNIPLKEVSHHGYGYLHVGAWTQGILNFVFGFSIFNLLLFPLIDLWCPIIIYYLAKMMFDERTAIFSSFVYAIMPSIIVISTTNIRFSLSIFSFLLIALFIVKFSETNSFKHLFVIAISSIIFVIFRDKAASSFLIIMPLILLLALNIRIRTKLALLAISALLFIILLNKSVFIQYNVADTIRNIIGKQVGFITTGLGNIYKIYDEIVYNHDIKEIPISTLIKMLPKGLLRGVTYFIFAPFPWQVTNVARLYVYPQLIFWYFLIPFALIGMVKGLFFEPKKTLPIILLCSYYIVLLSLTLGNEGITMRYRDLISPFFYIFAGSILCKFIVPSEPKNSK